MLFLLLGALTLLVVMSALGMFSRAQVATIKAFGLWFAGIAGLLLAAMLFLTGRGASALAVLGVLGPLLWSWRAGRSGTASPRGTAGPHPGPHPRAGRTGMSREEALSVLGLQPGADRAAIQAAYVRLMQAAHPDRGGSDWLAARINQARDVLLG